MKGNIRKLAIFVIILVGLGAEAKAQIPKEGATSFISPYSGTLKALAMGKERVQMAYESMGQIIGETPEDIFHNASFRCLGALHAVKGQYDNSGFCISTRPDGDQIFWTYKSAGKMGVGGRGTSTYVGGTGKLTGIQGNSEYTYFSFAPLPKEPFKYTQKERGNISYPEMEG